MKLKAMLTVDLKNCTPLQRISFNSALAQLNWHKHKLLTTLWTATFGENISESDAYKITQNNLKLATSKAGISDYDVAAMFSEYVMREYTG
jgi:hypothetical protein